MAQMELGSLEEHDPCRIWEALGLSLDFFSVRSNSH